MKRNYERAFKWLIRRFAPIMARKTARIRWLKSANQLYARLSAQSEEKLSKVRERRDRWRERYEADIRDVGCLDHGGSDCPYLWECEDCPCWKAVPDEDEPEPCEYHFADANKMTSICHDCGLFCECEQKNDALELCSRHVEKGATKFDAGKLRYDLPPMDAFKEVVHIYTTGAEKYGAHNWEKGTTYSRLYAALMRHLQAWWSGEDKDKDQPTHFHLAAVAWYALGLLAYHLRGLGTDDRPKRSNDGS